MGVSVDLSIILIVIIMILTNVFKYEWNPQPKEMKPTMIWFLEVIKLGGILLIFYIYLR